MELVRKVAHYIVSKDLAEIPVDVVEKGKRCILDGLGCGLYGQEFEATKIISGLAREWKGRPEASIIGAGGKVPAIMAAKVNGVAIHVADFDDSSVVFRGHPTSVALPPVLALAESEQKSGKDLLLAYILGIEVGGKLGRVMGWSHYEAGWHGTGTIGTIAAAAAASKVLGLDEQKTSHALAIAASEASGIRENFGSMVKSLHAGQAASAGVQAALLARKGYEGSMTAFEGKSGFRQAFSGGTEIIQWPDDLGEPWVLKEVAFKRYPVCATTHPALDALEDLLKTDPFSWQDVEDVECRVPPMVLSILIHPEPKTGLEAKFSMEYCIAAFLVHGRLDMSHFEKEALDNKEVRGLMKKVRMVADEGMGALFKEKDLLAPTETRIRLKGRTLMTKMLEAKGGISFPLDVEDVKDKFRTCAKRILSPQKMEKTVDLVLSLESMPQIGTLIKTLIPTHVDR